MKHLFFVLMGLQLTFGVGCSDTKSSPQSQNDDVSDDDTATVGLTENETVADTATDSSATSDSATEISSTDDCATPGDKRTTLQFVNQCGADLRVEGSDIEPAVLNTDTVACRNLGSDREALSAMRFWGYLGPDPGGEHHTLAEFTFNTDFYDFDWYNISHVDAHNLSMAILPLDMADCPSLVCEDELLSDCPAEGRFLIDGELVSCVSPDRDNPDSPVAQYFDQGCAQAYSWSGDDADSMAACAGEDYAVVFCP